MAEGLDGLRVYRLAEALADEIWKDVSTWEPFARETVGRQLVEAADSIGSNIAEGYGRYYFKENRLFQLYARGSLYEARYWLRRGRARSLFTPSRHDYLLGQVELIAPQLNSYIKTLVRRIDARNRRVESGKGSS